MRYTCALYIGVRWQRYRNTCRSLRQLDNQGTYRFLSLAVAVTGSRVRSFVRGGERLFRTRGMIGSRSVYGTTLMSQYVT